MKLYPTAASLTFAIWSMTLTHACTDDVPGLAQVSCLRETCVADAASDAPKTDACVAAGETCNGMDDDCDGLTDESFPEAGACGPSLGECQSGTRSCVFGLLTCDVAFGPADETCNGQDDDCDGLTDEESVDEGAACGPPQGSCPAPTDLCMAGALVCPAAPVPSPEACNGLDDDCDGAVDETLATVGDPCGSATGVCLPGRRVCLDGVFVCDGEHPPTPELCNALDDDCDGNLDEGPAQVGEPCGEPEACGGALFTCEAGQLLCVGAPGPGEELCNGRDDDCDGRLDEADPMAGGPCGEEVGECELGELRCVAGSILCYLGVSPVDEVCDLLDNDCDGRSDEDDASPGVSICSGFGESCAGPADCGSGGLCLNDFGQRYCTARCDGVGDCEGGFVCDDFGEDRLCRRDYPACDRDAQCEAGDPCVFIPGRSPDRVGAECRPPREGGLPFDAPCGGELGICANSLCLGPANHCSQLCGASEECPAGARCLRTPYVLENGMRVEIGLCLPGCTGDADCDANRVCQYDLAMLQEGLVGACDARRDGAAVGEPCNLGAMPPQRCDHAYCRRVGDERYCTQGCVTADDCLPTWTCEPQDFQTSAGPFSLGICQRP